MSLDKERTRRLRRGVMQDVARLRRGLGIGARREGEADVRIAGVPKGLSPAPPPDLAQREVL